MKNWTTSNLPDLHGKTAIVTGANSGIGYHTAFWLAAKGARTVLACRSLEKGHQAARAMLARQPGLLLEVLPLDLADLESVRGFAAVMRERQTRLDLLINNAGVMAIPLLKTADGFEMQFGVNHLGHFALTGLLLDRLLAAPGGRVVTVSSMAHLRGKIDFDNLNAEKNYRKWAAYSQSKLANLLFAYELQRRLATRGAQTISLATNPGYAATNLQLVGPQLENRPAWERVQRIANHLLAQSAEKSALTSLFAAADPSARGGDYIQPARFTAWGTPIRSQSSPAGRDPHDAARLWQISAALTGVRFPI